MDIQYILDPYACVMYIATYMLKNEGAMSELLKNACRECREDIQVQLRCIQSVFLIHRKLSAQEAAYRIIVSLPLKQLSRKMVFVNASPKEERITMLKQVKELQKMEDDSENIYLTSQIDRYVAQPDTLDDKSLAEFAANYTHVRGRGDEDDDADDTLPTPDEKHVDKQSTCIHLKYELGTMHNPERPSFNSASSIKKKKQRSCIDLS